MNNKYPSRPFALSTTSSDEPNSSDDSNSTHPKTATLPSTPMTDNTSLHHNYVDTLVHHANGPLNALSLSPDHQSVVVAGREVLKILSVHDNQITETLNLRTGARVNLNFSSNDVKWCNDYARNTIATAATNGAIVIWDIARSGHKLDRVINEHQRAVNRIAFHPNEPVILISASQDGSIKLWDLRMKSQPARYTFNAGKSESARDVQFSPSNAYEFVTAFENGQVQMWDLRHTNTYHQRFSAHNSLVLALDYDSSGRWLATGGRDKLIKVWDLHKTMTVRAQCQFQTIASVGRLAWRPSSDKVQLASSALLTDSRVLVWDLNRPFVPDAWLEDHCAVATGLNWSDSNILWSCGKDKKIVRRDIRTAYRPDIHLPRSAVSWGPLGDLVASITHCPISASEPSLDDTHSQHTINNPQSLFSRRSNNGPPTTNRSSENQLDTPDQMKQSPYVHNQHTVHVMPATPIAQGEWVHDIQALIYQADNYLMKGGVDFAQSCMHNAQVAAACGRADQYRTWQYAALVLAPLVKIKQIEESPSATSLSTTVTSLPRTSNASARHDQQLFSETLLGVQSPLMGPVGSVRSSFRSTMEAGLPANKSPFNTTNQSLSSNSTVLKTTPHLIAATSPTPTDSFSNAYIGLGLTSNVSPPDSIMPYASSSVGRGIYTNKRKSSMRTNLVGWRGGTTMWPMEEDGDVLGLGAAELMVKSVLLHHVDAGDLHITTTLTILLLDGMTSSDIWPHWLVQEQVEEWFVEYIDLLHRFKRYVIAAEVLHKCPIPEIRAQLQQSTTIQTLCNMCFKPIINHIHPKASWICDRCTHIVNPCSVCHRVVKGQYAWCQGCGHGGHVQCLSSWNCSECPTGCGHQCQPNKLRLIHGPAEPVTALNSKHAFSKMSRIIIIEKINGIATLAQIQVDCLAFDHEKWETQKQSLAGLLTQIEQDWIKLEHEKLVDRVIDWELEAEIKKQDAQASLVLTLAGQNKIADEIKAMLALLE